MYRKSLGIILFFAALVFFLPQILSTHIGKPFFIRLLENKLEAKIDIKELSLSWFGPQIFKNVSYSTDEIKGKIEEIDSNVPLWNLSGIQDSSVFKNGIFSFKDVEINNINGELHNNFLKASGKTTGSGYFSIQGEFYTKKNFNLTIDISNAPTIALDSIAKTQEKLSSILGSTFNLKGRFNKGEEWIHLNLSSPNLTSSLNAKWTEDSLTLNKPLTVEFYLTESLSHTLMGYFNPLFLTGIRKNNPIPLVVSDKDFSCPLPFSLKTFRIGYGSIDMGQVECQAGASFLSILTLLKQTSRSNRINLWFSPLTFHLKNGILETERMDGLIDRSIHICTWGSINLIQDSLNMFLGIPADTLSHLFGIKNIHPNYVLKVALTGSIQDPELAKAEAAAKIAAIRASQEIPKINKFLNPLIHIFSTVQDDQDAPPPKRPFPWEK